MRELWESTSADLAEQVKATGMANIASTIDGLLKSAEAWKPSGYDAGVAKRRDYFAGLHDKHLRTKLAERFPNQHAKMSSYPVPLFRHLAEQQATVYRAPPRREVTGDAALTERVGALYEGALANARLARVEQIAAAARLAFVRVSANMTTKRLVLSPRWPDSVHVVPDPDCPTDLQRAFALVAEINSADGVRSVAAGKRRFEVWERTSSGWSMAIAESGGGTGFVESTERWALLPWVAVPYEELTGSLYEPLPQDDIAVCDAISVLHTDLLYTIENQAFTQVWYSGPEPDKKLIGGPGVCWNAGDAGTFGSLTYQPQIASVKETADNLIGRWLALHSLSPTTASADPTYESGVALKVKNQPMLEARLARVPLYREIEQYGLWPIMRDQAGALDGEAWPEDAELTWTPGELQLPLDDEAEFRLAQARVASNVSNWPQEMVKLRLAPTLEAAKVMYDDNAAANAANPVTVGIPFMRSAVVGPAAPQGSVAEGAFPGVDPPDKAGGGGGPE